METNEYHKLADVEDRMWYFRSLFAHADRQFTHTAKLSTPTPELLDAGCGTGGYLRHIAEKFPRWRTTGIDYSQLAVDFTNQRVPTLASPARQASITALPHADASFDLVANLDVICQVPYPTDAAAAAREFHRVLRPGGYLLINVAAYMWMWSYHDDTCQSQHRYTRPRLTRLLTDAGFQIRHTTYWNTLPFPLLVIKRKLLSRPTDTSDVRLYPAPLEAFFNLLMRIEHTWIKHLTRLPYGSSVHILAQKPHA